MHLMSRHARSGAILILAACAHGSAGPTDAAVTRATAAITAPDILASISALAADSMLGRNPGTLGEERAVRYITSQFQSIGLAAGNPDGTWLQNVELLGFTATPTASFHAGSSTIPLDFPKDYVAASRREAAEID